MKANDIVKTLMSEKGMTQGELTKILEMKSQSGVSAALNRDMRVSTLIRFLNNLDCELVIREKDSGREFEVQEG